MLPMSAEAAESTGDAPDTGRASREGARQETVSFETPRPKSVPPPGDALALPEARVRADDEPRTSSSPEKSGKKAKAARQETKPFAVVRDAGAPASTPRPPEGALEPTSDTEAAITAVGEIASEAKHAAKGALESTGRAASAATRGVSRRIDRAQARVEEHLEGERAEWAEAEDDAALPDVLPGEPLADLAVRIDREADFWRAFAIRSLRPGGPRNVAIAAAAIGVGSAVVLGVVGAFGALLGIESAGVDLLETAIALAALLLASVLMAAFVERTRRDAAARALARAEVAERRLERVAAILELKKTDEGRYRDALARLERDPTR